MKKLKFLLAVLICAGLLSACASNNIPLTDKESDAIAQYCAHLLLKYDKNKVDNRKLLDIDEIEDYYKELHKDDPIPTPTPKAKDNTPTKAPEPTKKAEDKATPTPVGSDSADLEEDTAEKEKSLTAIYGKKEFTIAYSDSKLSKSYNENEYSTITAKDGEMIFTVGLKIKNVSDAKAKFVSNDSKVGYALYCDNGEIYAPEISMLSNDIQFLSDDIGSGKEYDSILLFIINEKCTPVRLRAENGDTGKVFDIKF